VRLSEIGKLTATTHRILVSDHSRQAFRRKRSLPEPARLWFSRPEGASFWSALTPIRIFVGVLTLAEAAVSQMQD
jgi:hypothetical protein